MSLGLSRGIVALVFGLVLSWAIVVFGLGLVHVPCLSSDLRSGFQTALPGKGFVGSFSLQEEIVSTPS